MYNIFHILVQLCRRQLSKPILSDEGKKLGLIDAIVSSQELLKTSRQWALEISDGRKPWLRSLQRTDKIESLSEAREIIKAARMHAKKTAPNIPQYQECLDVIEEGIVHGGQNGLIKVVWLLYYSFIDSLCAFSTIVIKFIYNV